MNLKDTNAENTVKFVKRVDILLRIVYNTFTAKRATRCLIIF